MGTEMPRPMRNAVSVLIGFCALLCASTNAAQAPERTLIAPTPRAISDAELTNHHGKLTRLSQFNGAPLLVFFGFTHCPSVCPAALTQLRQLEVEHKADLGRTRIVIISVDGERDTPQALAQWLSSVSKNFVGLTAPPAKVREIAREFSAAFYKTPGAASDYSIEHSSQVFLIDADGKLRATFFNAPVATMAQVTRSVSGR